MVKYHATKSMHKNQYAVTFLFKSTCIPICKQWYGKKIFWSAIYNYTKNNVQVPRDHQRKKKDLATINLSHY